MAQKKPALGRGLNAIIAESGDQPAPQSGVTTLPLTAVEPNPLQPRKNFDEEALAQLAASIAEHGIIQPLAVKRTEEGRYVIIAGERRYRAARMAGLSELPVVIMEADARHTAELALVENLQREDLNPIEEAEGFRRLIDEFGLTQETAASRVGRSRPAMTNSLRLLGLEERVKELVRQDRLSAGHARALAALPADRQHSAALAVIEGGLSVRDTEKLVKKLSTPPKPAAEEDPLQVDYPALLEKRLESRFGRRVRVTPGKKKGRIELEYYGNDDLDALLELLGLSREEV